MSNKTSLFAWWYILLLFASCRHEEQSSKINPDLKPFFDLKNYFDGEVQRLNSKGSAKKIVIADDKLEEKTIDSIDFKMELGIFAASNINRPAWLGKYVVDSIFDAKKELIQLDIKAIDDNLKTRKILVDFEAAIVSKIYIENSTLNSIANSIQVLIYQPSLGYALESHQKVATIENKLFKVEVQFIK